MSEPLTEWDALIRDALVAINKHDFTSGQRATRMRRADEQMRHDATDEALAEAAKR